MGKTGAGKSSFIELLGGKDLRGQAPEVSDGLESCEPRYFLTSRVYIRLTNLGIRTLTTYTTTVENNSILLLDTPGFDDSVRGNIDVLRDIVSNLYLFTFRKEEIKVRGVIFLYDISVNRFAGSQAKTLEILKAICGGDCMGNVIVGTTMWDQNSKNFPHQVRREESFCKKYWQGIHSTTRLFEDDEAAAGRIILDLLALPPVLLLVQKEIMKPPHTIENTTVWKSAMPDGYREIEELKHQKNAQAGVFEAELNQHKADFEKREQEMRRIAEDHLRKAEEEIRRSEEVRLKHEAEMMKQYEETKLEFTKQMKKRVEEEEKRDLLKQNEEVNQRLQEAKNTRIEKEKQDQINEADRITFTCTAEGCHKAFQAATDQLVRKALMRHLFRYQKDGVEIPKDAQDSDLTAKQIFNRAHHLAYQIEVVAYSMSPLNPNCVRLY